MENKEKFLIIDGNSIMNRAFYAIRLLSTKDGLYTNALYGFLNIYYMMLEKINPDYVAVSFDLSAPTFRHKMYNKYKAGRKSMPDELRMQMPLIKDILRAMTVPIFEIEGYEADDILGTVAKQNDKKGIQTYILTGDRDSFQLITDLTHVVIPTSKMGKTEYTDYTPEVLKEKYGIYPRQVVDVKALMGDSSDNIPGVPGIGEKTAYGIIQKYDTLEYIYNNIDTIDIKPGIRTKLKQEREIADLSKELATINTDVPIDLNYEDVKFTDVNIEELTKIFTRLQFKKFLDRYGLEETEVKVTDLLNTFNEKNFVKLQKISELDVDGKDKVSFVYLDESFENSLCKNKIFILNKDKVFFFDTSDTNLLKGFASIKCEKIGFNIKPMIKKFIDEKLENIEGFNQDVVIEYYLLHSEENNYTIENIAYRILDINMPEKEEKKEVVQTSLFDIMQSKYNEEDISKEMKKYIYVYLQAILLMQDILIQKLKNKNIYSLYRDIEMPLVRTLADMESVGMYLDKNKLQEFGTFLEENIAKLQVDIYKYSGEEFNINSPLQLGKILFEKMNIPYPKKVKGNYSTDKDTLQEIIGEHEIIQKVLDYRALTKLKSTYVEGLLPMIDDKSRIHTTFMQTVTATGRLSSVEPNLQNIPVRTNLGGRIRECFIAEGDNIIVDADYSQIELRILAHMADDPKMINAFIKGVDIHTSTASEVFEKKIEEVTKEERSKAKAVNFGIVYGISEFGLAKNINTTRNEAKQYIDSYLSKYNKIDEYMKNVIKNAESKGFVSTLYGRRREVPELKAGNHNTVMFGKRVAMNMPIQGTAADIMKLAMNKVYYTLLERRLKSKLIMQVHDEILIETVPEELEEIKEILKTSMESIIELKVPLIADVNVAKNWYDAK